MSERKGSPLQPSGTTLQPSGTEPLSVQTAGTEPLGTETSGNELSLNQPPGINPLDAESRALLAVLRRKPQTPSVKKLINEATGLLKPDSQTPGKQPTTKTSPVEASSVLMPSFSTRITAPITGATLKSPTKTTQVKEMANAKEAKLGDEMAEAMPIAWLVRKPEDEMADATKDA